MEEGEKEGEREKEREREGGRDGWMDGWREGGWESSFKTILIIIVTYQGPCTPPWLVCPYGYVENLHLTLGKVERNFAYCHHLWLTCAIKNLSRKNDQLCMYMYTRTHSSCRDSSHWVSGRRYGRSSLLTPGERSWTSPAGRSQCWPLQ